MFYYRRKKNPIFKDVHFQLHCVSQGTQRVQFIECGGRNWTTSLKNMSLHAAHRNSYWQVSQQCVSLAVVIPSKGHWMTSSLYTFWRCELLLLAKVNCCGQTYPMSDIVIQRFGCFYWRPRSGKYLTQKCKDKIHMLVSSVPLLVKHIFFF